MISTGWPAPAKLNLFLHVTGRRADGYHLLQTVFQLLDFGDSLDFELRGDDAIARIEGPTEVPPEEDLVVRAAAALKAASGSRLGVGIRLHKRIPLGGGLGGGSSDAATVLVALNHLWNLGLGVDTLARVGLGLGADVPLFVRGESAWAEGVGERLAPIELPERWFAVLYPGVAVSTRAVFQAPELTRNSPIVTIRGFLTAGARNDCEPVVVVRYPEVRRALAWLGQRGEARLTGTGSCVFTACASRAEAERALEGLPSPWSGFVARGIGRSPLQDRLAAEPAGA